MHVGKFLSVWICCAGKNAHLEATSSCQRCLQGRQPAQTQELDTSRSHFELLTVSAGAATGADTGIGYISKPLRVVNGQSVGPAAVCGGRQRTQTEELGTSRSHFELLTVSSRLLDISTTRILDYSTNTKPRLQSGLTLRSIPL